MNVKTEKRDWKTMSIQPYKNRTIDFDKKVRVYRCLNRKGKTFSIQQGGLVVGHATHLSMVDCDFIVGKSGNLKCKTTRQRNVHAYIEGKIAKFGLMGLDENSDLFVKITYNPMTDIGFMCRNLTVDPRIVTYARGVIISRNGVSASYVN